MAQVDREISRHESGSTRAASAPVGGDGDEFSNELRARSTDANRREAIGRSVETWAGHEASQFIVPIAAGGPYSPPREYHKENKALLQRELRKAQEPVTENGKAAKAFSGVEVRSNKRVSMFPKIGKDVKAPPSGRKDVKGTAASTAPVAKLDKTRSQVKPKLLNRSGSPPRSAWTPDNAAASSSVDFVQHATVNNNELSTITSYQQYY